MINKKAPKDMTAVEFVEYLVSRKEDEKVLDVNVYYTLEFLKGRLNEPAPNPFTSDQLAWMRIECKEQGLQYAAIDEGNRVVLFQQRPVRDSRGNWVRTVGYYAIRDKSNSFLGKFLSPDDPEPLCFADYAPLEENK